MSSLTAVQLAKQGLYLGQGLASRLGNGQPCEHFIKKVNFWFQIKGAVSLEFRWQNCNKWNIIEIEPCLTKEDSTEITRKKHMRYDFRIVLKSDLKVNYHWKESVGCWCSCKKKAVGIFFFRYVEVLKFNFSPLKKNSEVLINIYLYIPTGREKPSPHQI